MKKNFVIKGICFSIVFVAVLVVFDYINFPSVLGLEMSNLNGDFLMGIINTVIVVVLYYFTYKIVDERTIQREKNKNEISKLLIRECYNECLDYIQFLNQDTVKQYIVPKIDFNSTNDNRIMNNLQNAPFLNESTIFDLVKDGQIEKSQIEGYLKIKSKFRQYINMRIIFFDSIQHYEPLKLELCEIINSEMKKLSS